ncbi:MAG: CBASS cGAMP synthase [Gammaproteobacteria bacterium]|nr:CBASS cGAMP synthase [Gammaproteobacteria bacterium]
MNKRRDFGKVFKQFGKNLQISDADNTTLLNVRRCVRKHLRQHFSNNSKVKFLTQGSFAYGTLNRPCRVPPQQMDLDDGAYFPVQINATVDSSQILFDSVDSALKSLADAEKWMLDITKPSCCRLIIKDNMHIDIPLYAVSEAVLDVLSDQKKYKHLYEEANIPYVDPDKVLLAHRTENWVESDPRKIINWVLDCKCKHGKQYIRVCRYFKAWRDHQWGKSSLKSILIMEMVNRAFNENSIANREVDDDEAVLEVAGLMIDYLSGDGIVDPTDASEKLDGDINLGERRGIIATLEGLFEHMELALCGDIGKKEAHECLCHQFGGYFPGDSNLISVVTVTPAAVVAPKTVTASQPWASKWR